MDLNFSQGASSWYASLNKPFFAPPSWLFGPVWTVLYILIGIALFRAISLWRQNKLKTNFILIFIFNLLTNFLFSPLQFGLQNNLLALIDIILVLISLTLLLIKAYRLKLKTILSLLSPYFLWVAFATILQFSITLMN